MFCDSDTDLYEFVNLAIISMLGCSRQLFFLSMMESPPTHRRSSTVNKDPSKSDSLCDRFVTGNPDLDNWIWIIEYFAKFKTELWMLHGNCILHQFLLF